MATSVPAAVLPALAVFLAASRVDACGALHGRVPDRCIDASQVASAPGEETAVEAFLLARRWLDLDALPAPSERSSQLELPGVTGVCVVLRQDGRLVGIGEDASAGPLMLRRAVGRAVSRALADETVRNIRAAAGDKVTARLSLELELAGPRSPLIGRTIGDAMDRMLPGDEGIALHRGDAVHLAFPARLLATDTASRPESTIAALMIEAGLPAKDLPEFATEDRVSLSKFATTRLRQPDASRAPSVVTRAGRTIDPIEVTGSFVDALAVRIASRLAAQVVPTTQSDAADAPVRGSALLGAYNPTADRHSPPFAEPRDAALAALALAEAAASERLPAPVRDAARGKSALLARSTLALPEDQRPAPVDELCLLALHRIDAADEGPTAAARGRILKRLDPREPAASVQSVALAIAAIRSTGVATERDLVEEKTKWLLAELAARPAAALEGSLPIALLARSPGVAPGVSDALRSALDAGAKALRAQQIAQSPADLVGGILPPGAPPWRADTSSLRFTAGFALALVPREPSDEAMALHRGTLRFLAQHTADDPWAQAFRRPESLRGLVRRSLTGDDCPPDATALGLLVALAGLGGR